MKYTEELTARHVPPTREMIANFALAVAQDLVSESCQDAALHRYAMQPKGTYDQ